MLKRILVLCFPVLALPCVGETRFVSPDGNDRHSGTIEKPLRTLEAARDAIRMLPEKGGHRVVLRAGSYTRLKTFELSGADAGVPGKPNGYKAFDGERVTLVGGLSIPNECLSGVLDPEMRERLPETARGKVLSFDYRALGATGFDEEGSGGLAPEVYCDGRPLHVARWPNTGYCKTGKIIRQGSVPRYWKADMKHRPEYIPPEKREDPRVGGIFEYGEDRATRWSKAENIRMFGFWKFDWYAEVLTVKRIDSVKRHIETQEPHLYGIFTDRRYYVFDLPEELDVPGESYVDRKNGRVYFYPFPSADGSPEVKLSQVRGAMVSLKETSDVVISGLNFEVTRGPFVQITGGGDNLIAGCSMRNGSNRGVGISGGTHNGVVSCDIHNTNAGITIGGGDRKTLTPAGNYARNNRISRFSRYGRTYTPAISLSGVGNIASHNEISDATHTGLSFSGNDHLIEYNEFHHVCSESDDMAAAYSGRDVTFQGNVFRYNYFHDIQTTVPSHVGTMGLYFDDLLSGTTVHGNIFERIPIGIMLNSGRDTPITNNLFIDVPMPVRLTCWGLTPNNVRNLAHHGHGAITNPHTMKPPEVVYNKPPFTKYPHLATFLEDEPGWPKYNTVSDNLLIRSGKLAIMTMGDEKTRLKKVKADNVLVDSLVLDDEPGLKGKTLRELLVTKPELIAAAFPSFKTLPVDQMGLQVDAWRKRLVCRAPVIDPAGGRAYRQAEVRIDASFLQPADEVGEIRYTTDGREPTAGSPVYGGAFMVGKSGVLKARLFPVDPAKRAPSLVTSAEFKIDDQAYLTNFEPLESACHGGLKINTNYHGKPDVSIQRVFYDNSLMVCPAAGTGIGYVTYDLGSLPPFHRFTAVVGIEDFTGDRGSCEFIVEGRVDGHWKELFKSPVMRAADKGLRVEAGIEGCDRLRLKTTIGGDHSYSDHALWCDPLLE